MTTTNTIVLITGANKGIGLETARLLGARGMTVLLGCRDAERGKAAQQELREGGADAHALSLEVTDEASVAAAVGRIDEEFGRLDVLINNAGIARTDDGAFAPSGTTLAGLRQVFETNVFGVVGLTNALLPLLRRSSSPRIVNVSSEVGSITAASNPDGPLWGLVSVPYPASKSALNMVTVQYAKELKEAGFLVNAANPGYCATDLNGHHGYRTAVQGAEVSVHLATLPDGGPTGQLWGDLAMSGGGSQDGVLPW